VVQWLEFGLRGHLGDYRLQTELDFGGDFHVLDGSAIDADEVVVMAPQPLCQLITRQALGGEVGDYHPRLFEYREGPCPR
jgi:hypothetical protein